MDYSLNSLVEQLLNNEFPFALYRLPKDTEYHLAIQQGNNSYLLNENYDFTAEKGFVFAPFIQNKKFPTAFIKPDIWLSFRNAEDIIQVELFQQNQESYASPSVAEYTSTDAETFQNQVSDTVAEIKTGRLNKSVLSAVTIKEVVENFEPLQLFLKLCSQYPDVFIYLVYTPVTGCWIGATPELLLKYSETQLETVSLAGTQFDAGNNGKAVWGKKEIEEQQLVTNHIQQSFEQNFSEPIEVSETKTISTGHLLHLRTDFKLLSQNGSLKKSVYAFLKNLHPTPAISGSPKEASVQHILNTEKHERAYYTGFLGPVNLHGYSQLFVNLRCLKYENHKLIIYTGAGITADSVPEKEWEEVQLKAQTILKVL